MEKFAEDTRLFPSHISLYLGLFAIWNTSRFSNPIIISREELMLLSKIRSRTTYLKCLHELSDYGYISYSPSRNPIIGSKVKMFSYCTSAEQDLTSSLSKNCTTAEQRLGPYINNNKLYKHKKEKEGKFSAPSLDDLNFYLKKIYDNKQLQINIEEESKKFINYYRSNGWRIGNNPMIDWKAAAENWIIKSIEFNGSKNKETTNRLHTRQDKDYGEPL